MRCFGARRLVDTCLCEGVGEKLFASHETLVRLSRVADSVLLSSLERASSAQLWCSRLRKPALHLFASIPISLHRSQVARQGTASAALRAGAEVKHALFGAGIESSHSYERTHIDSVQATERLVDAYLKSPIID